MKDRIISSLLLIVIAAVVVFSLRVSGCVLLIIIAGILTQKEFCDLMEKSGQKPFKKFGILCGTLIMVSHAIQKQKISWLSQLPESVFFSIVAIVVLALLTGSLEAAKKRITSTLSSIVYCPCLCTFPIALLLEMRAHGANDATCISTFFWTILTTKCCDIGGMFVGKTFGKHKIAPQFSPKKTVEGLIGGTACSATIGALLFVCCRRILPQKLNITIVFVLSVGMALLAFIGDLVESVLKRAAGEKDSGRMIPGLGGIFDLTDSLMLSLPFASIVLRHYII